MFALVVVSSVLVLARIRNVDAETETTTQGERQDLNYDPENLLSRILGYNDTSSRQSGYGLAPEPFLPSDPPPAQPADSQGPPNPKKRRRRRRKPKLQQGYGLQQGGSQLPAGQLPAGNFGYQPPSDPQLYGQYYAGGQQRPPRRRASALSALSRALGSIARYDDYQCVPRLLCEVASGKDSSGGGTQGSLLPTFINMQPLVTLLAAYNGMSTSPLFVFGRAALLGVTSPGNAASCRYAYPLCPADPDRLLDYLNNHNGGFFRFFNGAPDLRPDSGSVAQLYPQGLQQFYSHLANIPLNQNVEFPNPNLINQQQTSGIYQQGLQGQFGNNYGQNYGYGSANIRFKSNDAEKGGDEENRIEDRIQNSPEHRYEYVSSLNQKENNILIKYSNDYFNSKWSFPEKVNSTAPSKLRIGKAVIFPQQSKDTESSTHKSPNRLAKGFAFPGSQSNRNYIEYYNYPPVIHPSDIPLKTGTGDLKFDSSDQEPVHYGYSEVPSDDGEEYYTGEDNGEVIYILRGDGDPNNPEVVKVRPGQRIN